MSYQHERDEFIAAAVREGLDLQTCRKLLRYASTLQRLAEAQCNGDWPFNGDRDRPSCACGFVEHVHDAACQERKAKFDRHYTVCPKCEASGVAKAAMRPSTEEYTHEHVRNRDTAVAVCPDCRTQELVRALLLNFWQCNSCKRLIENARLDSDGYCPDCPIKSVSRVIDPIFQGDPRGAVLLLATPNYPWSEDGRGRGLYVPARSR